MSDTVSIPRETLNRLQACLIEVSALIVDTSKKEVKDTPEPPSKEDEEMNSLEQLYPNF